jgi:hypothetical protein
MRSRQTETAVKVEIERRSDSLYLTVGGLTVDRRLFKKVIQQGRSER